MKLTHTLALSALTLALSGVAYSQSSGPGLMPPPNSNKAPSANEAAPAPAPAPAAASKPKHKLHRLWHHHKKSTTSVKDPAAAATPGMTPNPGRDSSGALPPGGTKGDAGVAGTGSGTGKP